MTQFRFFTIMEYEKEEKYLEKQHQEGWRFTHVTFPGFYHFEQCKPEAIVYQLDYNQDGTAHKEEYIQMFHDCGWEYVTDFVGYSYFRKPAAELGENEGIFCDDNSQVQMMERIFKSRMLPLFIILFAMIIPQLILQFSFGNMVCFAIFLILFVVYMIIFIQFFVRYRSYKKNIR